MCEQEKRGKTKTETGTEATIYSIENSKRSEAHFIKEVQQTAFICRVWQGQRSGVGVFWLSWGVLFLKIAEVIMEEIPNLTT